MKKTKIVTSGATTSWPIDGGKMETVADFIFLGSKITGWWLQPLAPWKESYDKPKQFIKKQRHHFLESFV